MNRDPGASVLIKLPAFNISEGVLARTKMLCLHHRWHLEIIAAFSA
jgi:hypothetical protein